jgi:hypothetical protein
VFSDFPIEYVEAYEPRAGFIHPYDRDNTLGPLGEMILWAHRVTKNVLLDFPMEYVEAYEPRAGLC